MLFYEPLYQKYRPQNFNDLVGQEPIVVALSNAIKFQRISHAYLFTGPRGTGKTSTARILAKSINCLELDVPNLFPCGNCEACKTIVKGSSLDVVEIDAASNTGVDNIRVIIEQAKFAPIQLRYKVYIIDECHMLSTAAFNALLKILEEPPKQVIFILATTDPQRVIPTIISRCQRFDYRRISTQVIAQHLDKIANKEDIDIESEALTLVAQISNGGLRDAESLLDQLSLFPGKINSEKVNNLVGLISEKDLLSLLQAIRSNNSILIIELCRKLINQGKEPLIILQNIAKFYLNLLISKVSPGNAELTFINKKHWEELCIEAKYWETDKILKHQQKLKDSESQLKNTTQPYLWIEIILLDLIVESKEFLATDQSSSIANENYNSEELKVNSSKAENQAKPSIANENYNSEELKVNSPKAENQAKPSIENIVESNVDNLSTLVSNDNLEEVWNLILGKLPPFLAGLIKEHGSLLNCKERAATVGMSTSPLLDLAKSKLSQIELAFQEVLGHKVSVSLKVETKPKSGQNLLCKSNSNITNDKLHDPINNVIKDQKLNGHVLKIDNSEIVLNINKDSPHNPGRSSSAEVSEQIPKVSNFAKPSDNEITQIAKRLAIFFKGEIIHDSKNEKISNYNQDSSISDNEIDEAVIEVYQDRQFKEEENNKQKQFISSNKDRDSRINTNEFSQKTLQKKIKGRPAITAEEDLDF